jgi:hypothetical protein
MIISLHAVLNPFGLHFYSENKSKESKKYKDWTNRANLVSVLPGVRIIIGLWRIKKYIPLMKGDLNSQTCQIELAQIARGVIELTSYGQWLIIPDVLVTLLRLIKLIGNQRFQNS